MLKKQGWKDSANVQQCQFSKAIFEEKKLENNFKLYHYLSDQMIFKSHFDECPRTVHTQFAHNIFAVYTGGLVANEDTF